MFAAVVLSSQVQLPFEVELCVQRRTALEQIDEGVPDWEDENIGQEWLSAHDHYQKIVSVFHIILYYSAVLHSVQPLSCSQRQ